MVSSTLPEKKQKTLPRPLEKSAELGVYLVFLKILAVFLLKTKNAWSSTLPLNPPP